MTARVIPFDSSTSASPGHPDPGDTRTAFRLHSRVGAPKRILLDFDGHVITGSAWNSPSRRVIQVPPYSTDNDTAFSVAELENIITIWRAVAEDFAPWDVDVTTEDDGHSLAGNGVRAVIGGSSCLLGQCKMGGIAYLGSFGSSFLSPAFIFSENLHKGWPKYVAEAASHEIGHTVGLTHDGQSPGTEYYPGDGHWAPIMGVSYKATISQWSRGEYPDANNRQDDISVISRYLPLRSDDHGDSSDSATPLEGKPVTSNGSRLLASAIGCIGWTSDSDWFVLDAGSGDLVLELDLVPNANPLALSPYIRADADVTLKVLGPNDYLSSLASFDAAGGLLTGRQQVALPAGGRYYIVVTGTGDAGDIGEGSGGWPAYGSLGEYRLRLEYPAPAAAGGGAGGGSSPPPLSDVIKELRVKLVSFSAQFRSGGSKGRVLDATLVVTDMDGVGVAGATVKIQWSNLPASSSSDISNSTSASASKRPPGGFKPVTRILRSSAGGTSNGGVTGSVTTSSPYAAGPRIYLRVLSLAPPVLRPSSFSSVPPLPTYFVLNRPDSDLTTEFSWDISA